MLNVLVEATINVIVEAKLTSELLLSEGKRSIFLLQQCSCLQHTRHQLLGLLSRCLLVLAVSQLLLELLYPGFLGSQDSISFLFELLLAGLQLLDLGLSSSDDLHLVRLQVSELFDLCFCPPSLRSDLEKVSSVARLGRDSSAVANHFEYLWVNSYVEVITISQLLVTSLDFASHKVAEGITYHGEADVEDPLDDINAS